MRGRKIKDLDKGKRERVRERERESLRKINFVFF
jgi:hypothetical protein